MKMSRIVSSLLTVPIVLSAINEPPGSAESRLSEVKPEQVTLTIIYDNRAPDRLETAEGDADTAHALRPGWGFACLVEGLESTILFDTGGYGRILLGNMHALGLAETKVDVVVLSHAHDDHAGGLEAFLGTQDQVELCLLDSFPDAVSRLGRARGTRIRSHSGPMEICAGAALTGEMRAGSGPPEQSLVLSMENGAVVLTGCAHPGITDITRRAGEIAGQDVIAVIGGFHLLRESDEFVREAASELLELGVRWAGPCHCTGDRAIEIFAETYGPRFLPCHVGAVVSLNELLGGAAAE